MRLWPLSILTQLPRQQLLGQHRECCALRGKGWGRKHATVDYVFSHPREWLYEYHMFVIAECLLRRHYRIDPKWIHPNYCGKNLPKSNTPDLGEYEPLFSPGESVYPEHDDAYLDECISNLARKGVKITKAIGPEPQCTKTNQPISPHRRRLAQKARFGLLRCGVL